MTTVDNDKKEGKVLSLMESYGKDRNDSRTDRSDVNSVSAETLYHINRHVIYYLSPFGLSKFGVIDNPDKVVKKRMPDTICYLLKHYKRHGNIRIFADSNFKYICIYKLSGTYAGNMETNLLYFGYTLEEIKSMTIDEIVDDLLSR